MESWAKDWDNPQDSVYDKIRSSVVSAKEKFEAPIRADERERIIKLLEALDTCNCDEDDPNPKHYRCGTTQGLTPRQVIALIKGKK